MMTLEKKRKKRRMKKRTLFGSSCVDHEGHSYQSCKQVHIHIFESCPLAEHSSFLVESASGDLKECQVEG